MLIKSDLMTLPLNYLPYIREDNQVSYVSNKLMYGVGI